MSGKIRLGLALSGGGSKGAFTVGVLRMLRTIWKNADIRVVSGTSTGALIGTLVALHRWARLTKIYSTVVTESIVNPNHALVARLLGDEAVLFASAILGGSSIYDTAGLENVIRTHVDFAELKRRAAQTLVIYSTVDLQTGAVVTFDTKRTSASVLPKALLASSNMPVLMPPVPIARDGATHQYVDGGVREFLPIGAIFDSGVDLDHIVAISTAPIRPSAGKGEYTDITDILGRTIDLLSTEVGYMDTRGAQLVNALLRVVDNATAHGVSESVLYSGVRTDIKRSLKGKRLVPVTYIGPSKHLDMSSLEFNPPTMKKAMDHGMRRGKAVFKKLRDSVVRTTAPSP